MQHQVTMIWWIPLLIVSALFPAWSAFEALTPLSQFLHSLCLNQMPLHSKNQNLYAALICGAKLSSEEADPLRTTGLYHLFVVSGAHLLFLENHLRLLFQKLGPRGRPLVYLLLVLYMVTCQFTPPVTRAFISLTLRSLNEKLQLFWPSHLLVSSSIVICLALSPTWISSWSLLFSYTACLALSLGSSQEIPSASLKRNTLVYLFLTPFVLNFGGLHPWSVLINSLLAPILGLILFPLSFLGVLFHSLSPLIDFFWDLLLGLIRHLSHEMQTSPQTLSVSRPMGWMYVMTLHISLHYFWLRKCGRTGRPSL